MPEGTDSLEVFDFGLLLQALSQSLRVGALRVTGLQGEKYIYFSRGKVKAIYTRKSKVRIGKILYNLRVIGKKELKDVIDDQAAGRVTQPLGDELVARGLIRQDALDAAIRYQMTEELLEIFYWKDYSYEFISGPAERSLKGLSEDFARVGGSQNVGDLLLNVSRIIDDMEKFNRIIPSVRDIYELTVDPQDYLERQGGSNRLFELLGLIDGQRDLREILNEMRMNRFDVVELLCRMRTEEIIRPKNGLELLLLGENQRTVFPPEKLERIYQRVRELGLDGFDVTLKLAEVNEQLGRLERAAELFVEHAEDCLEKGESEKAEECSRRAVDLFPESTANREVLARVLEARDDPQALAVELRELASIHRREDQRQAEESVLCRALGIEREDASLLAESAEARHALGRTREAAQDLFALAAVKRDDGDDAGAEEALERAVEMAPSSIRFRNALVGQLVRMGKEEEAGEELCAILGTLEGRSAVSGRSPIRGLRAVRSRARSLELNASAVAVPLAEAYAAAEDIAAAREVLVQAAEANHTAGRIDEARNVLGRSVRIVPDDLELRKLFARILTETGELDEAMLNFRRIAKELEAEGDTTEAILIYKETLVVRPIAPQALESLAELLAKQGRKEEAAIRLAQVGQLHRAAGLSRDAVGLFDRACGLDPQNTEHLLALAEALAEALEMDRSLESYRRLMRLLQKKGEHAAAIDAGLRILKGGQEAPEVRESLRESYLELGRLLESPSGGE